MTRTVDALSLVGPSRYDPRATLTVEELVTRSEVDVQLCAVATPPNRDIAAANADLFTRAFEHGERIGVLARVDPLDSGWTGYVTEAIERGCKGLYVDPWSDSYSVADCAQLDHLTELAAATSLPVVVESGYPVLSAPAQVGEFAARHPDVPVVATRGLQMNMSGLCLDTALLALERAANLHLLTSGVYRQDWLEILCTRHGPPHDLRLHGTPLHTCTRGGPRRLPLRGNRSYSGVARERGSRVRSDGPMTWTPDDRILHDARDLQADLVRIRRSLHQCPEVGLQLPATQEQVLRELHGLELEMRTGAGLSSVTALIRAGSSTRSPAPVVILRSDMDALPIVETSGEAFASTNDAMHACGHDLHMAMLIGAARLLAARREQLSVDVLLVFQPGEEGHGGAPLILSEPPLVDLVGRAAATYALHVFSKHPKAPVVATRPGPIMAGSSDLKIVLRGRGGHGSAPHEAADPVPAAANLILTLQSYVTRRFSVFDPVVISVGVLSAGRTANVIPPTVTVGATVRYLSEQSRARMNTDLVALCHAIAAAGGVEAEIDFTELSPPAINDQAAAHRAHQVSVALFGDQRAVILGEPLMASEDYAYFLRTTPGSLIFLGVSVLDDAVPAPNHAPEARFDDSRLFEGAALLTALVASHADEPTLTTASLQPEAADQDSRLSREPGPPGTTTAGP